MGKECGIGVHERSPAGGAVNHFGSRDALPTWEFSDMRNEMVEFILGWQDFKWTGGISDCMGIGNYASSPHCPGPNLLTVQLARQSMSQVQGLSRQ